LTTKFGMPGSRLAASVPGWNQAALALRAARKVLGGRGRSADPVPDYDPKKAVASLESSLRALRTDSIDVLYLHEVSRAAMGQPEPLTRALETLKASGKVRYIGLSGQLSECALVRTSHPALGEVLQVEIPPAADGSPGIVQALNPPAAVHFWELAATAPAG